MKRFLFILITFHLSLAAAFAQQLSDRYNKQHPLTIACDWDKPPYEFRDDRGQPAGSNIDVLRHICKQLNIPCQFVMKEWGNAIKTFERGDADLILANVNRFRGSKYYATQIINYNRIRVAMTKDTTDLISLKTLEQEGVVLKTGDYTGMYFKDIDSTLLSNIEYQSPKVALTGLLAGDCKYFVWGEEPLRWKIKELNLNGVYLNDVGIPVSEVHIIGRDKELIDLIDDYYSRLKQSGELEEMLNKWFHPERVRESAPPVAIYTTLGVLLLTLLIFCFNRLAKAHVRNATRNSTELNDMMYKALHMGNFNVMVYDIVHDRMTNRYGDILPDNGLTLDEFVHRIHPNQQDEFRQKVKLLMEGRDRRFELDKLWNTGTDDAPHWLNFQGHAISELDNDGRPAYIVNVVHDVTHDVEAAKAARELVLKYERLINMPTLAMSFYSNDGWLIELNDSMKELCGFNNEDKDAERYWRALNMFDIPLFRNALTAEDRHDLVVCQHMHYPDIDVDRYIEFHVLPLLDADGNVVNYFDSTIDITEERTRDYVKHQQDKTIVRTNADIERHKQRLTYLLDNSNRYLWHSDIENQKIYFYRSLGEPEVVMDFDTYLGYMVEEDRQRTRHILNSPQLLDSDISNDVFHFNHTIVSPNEGWFKIDGTPIHDANGQVVGHRGVSIDITDYILAQKQLAEATRRAEDSVRLKSGFMASMTHELRTPLNAIVGFTGVLDALGASPERAEYVRIVRNSSDMLQRLINDIIEASSISDGEISIQPEDVNFATAFDDICLTLQQRVQGSGLEFLKENPYKSFLTTLDIGRIQQVLTNFVTNAVKFTKEGYIRVGYRYEKHGLYIYCVDTGIGIAPDKQKVVFDRFVKLDEFVQGTGMGLAICKSIVERCGGTIGVDSEGEGKGSTFWVHVPCERRISPTSTTIS